MTKEKISLPNKITFTDGQHEHEQVLTMEPFYKGYGTTVGNALRRVLLSSLTGAAITQIKIKGADHEFTALEGVKEDVVDIMLNVKNIRFKMYTNEPVTLRLTKKGITDVVAGDFEANSDIEVVTPDVHIASLSSKSADFEMEVVVQSGRGYEPVEKRSTDKQEIGTIAVDAQYSPVVNVSMEVTQARVGQDINFDKLILGIQTDGTLTAEEAVERSAQILVEHFALLSSAEPTIDESAVSEEDDEAESVDEPVEKKSSKKSS